MNAKADPAESVAAGARAAIPARRGLIRSLDRGLRVLRAIAEVGADPAALAVATSLDRTTIYRILYTLEAGGYLVRNPSDHSFRLTRQVRTLGDGFTDSLWVAQIGARQVCALCREVGWPSTLATFDGEGMLVRESTHRFSGLMPFRTMVGVRLPMASSLGMAFAANTVEAAQPAMLRLLVRDARISESAAVARLAEVRSKGYALAVAALEENISAIAVPVFHRDSVVAAINIVVSASLMSSAAIPLNFLRPLQGAAERLRQALSSLADNEIV
jgi:IclR family transcriptional regulator, mhp operon transcriptional activator